MPVAPRIPSGKLNVVTCISNPVRYNSRVNLYKRFVAEMEAAGAPLLTVEAAFGDRPHEVTRVARPQTNIISTMAYAGDPPPTYGSVLQLQTDHEVWHKENMLNLGIQRLPKNWEYLAWVDADITFINPNWMGETLEALQHYPVVQMWESAIDEGPTGAVMSTYTSFAKSFLQGLPYGPGAGGSYGPYWHSGFAWAIRRDAFEALGGLIDFAILGAADHHMALSFIGRAAASLPGGVNEHYAKQVFAFQERAKAADVLENIGVVPGTIAHHFHGSKRNRNYVGRWEVLVKHDFDPTVDISRDYQGLWQLTPRGLRMRNDLRLYFRSRNEDGVDE